MVVDGKDVKSFTIGAQEHALVRLPEQTTTSEDWKKLPNRNALREHRGAPRLPQVKETRIF